MLYKLLDMLFNFSDYNTKGGFYKAILWAVITMGVLTMGLNLL